MITQQLVAGSEKVRLILEEKTGEAATLSRWAEATGVKKKELLHHLHYAWHCMDELVRSTRSLVLFIARIYRGWSVLCRSDTGRKFRCLARC